jgi:hypothetical protein
MEKECCVCLEDTDNKLECGHITCTDCCSKLISKKCPLCRQKIVNPLIFLQYTSLGQITRTRSDIETQYRRQEKLYSDMIYFDIRWALPMIREYYNGPLQWNELVALIKHMGCIKEFPPVLMGDLICGLILLPLVCIAMILDVIPNHVIPNLYRKKEKKRLIPELSIVEYNLIYYFGDEFLQYASE